MENKEIIQDDVKKAIMQDVRKAHRLVFEYQKRMLQLVFLFKDKLGFVERMEGKKHFSDPIKPIRGKYGELKIGPWMWAWDYIYSYEMEYFFGERFLKDTSGNNVKCAISALQISDTGCFDKDDAKQKLTSTFMDAAESKSYLVIFFKSSKTDNKNSVLKFRLPSAKDLIAEEFHVEENTEHGHSLWYRIDIEDLMTSENIATKIEIIAKEIKDNAGVDLLSE